MNETNSARLIIGALNLLAVSGPLAASPIFHSTQETKKIENLNAASFKSLEGTWLEVPASCKARGFNASPTVLANTEISPDIKEIYSSFGA